jgi:hypothetical protein
MLDGVAVASGIEPSATALPRSDCDRPGLEEMQDAFGEDTWATLKEYQWVAK